VESSREVSGDVSPIRFGSVVLVLPLTAASAIAIRVCGP
jgi:hypothetical protein